MGKRNSKNISTLSPSAELRQALDPYLHMDDPWVIDVALATIVANAMPGDPLWMLFVNPSSTGKTEYVQLFDQVVWCEWLAEITDNTLLSGLQSTSEERSQSKSSTTNTHYSLLHRWTDPKLRQGKPPVRVMLIQDLTGMITQDRRKRDAIFGQLRQTYDGRLVKSTGMGDDLVWKGYLGCLGAVTPVIDTVVELNTTLGERFILYRPMRRDSTAEAEKQLSRKASSRWREQMARKTATIVEQCVAKTSGIHIRKRWQQRVVALAQFVAYGRTMVSRDGYTKDVKYFPEPEGPGRLTGQLSKLLRGLCVVRGRRSPSEVELQILAKVARDSLPALRLKVLEAIWKADWTACTAIPKTTFRHIVEDLQMLGIVEKGQSSGKEIVFTESFRRICEEGRVFPTA